MQRGVKQGTLFPREGARMSLFKNAALPRAATAGTPPAHEQVYQDLRSRILFGEMAPGQPVTIKGLTETLGAGITPVREAIRRLISDGALVFQGNRRVSVPTLTAGDLDQLVFVRKSVECELARRAAGRITAATLARLGQIDAALDEAIALGDVTAYLALNHQFHQTLYAEAGAPILAELASALWLRFGPSLRVVCGRFGTENLPDRHKDLLDALARGDAAAVVLAMGQDIEQGMEQMAAVLPDSIDTP